MQRQIATDQMANKILLLAILKSLQVNWNFAHSVCATYLNWVWALKIFMDTPLWKKVLRCFNNPFLSLKIISTNRTVRALTRWSDETSHWRLSKLNYFFLTTWNWLCFNLFHANVPLWEHKINIGLKFLHKEVNSKGTLFLQLLWWNLLTKISKLHFYFLYLAISILTYIYNFQVTWLHVKYIFLNFLNYCQISDFVTKIPIK